MSAQPNIYSTIVFDLHPKVKDFIASLNEKGQIDLDDSGYPYILSVDKTGSNISVNFARNGKQENFILNTRKRADPVTSYDPLDGVRRTGGRKVISVGAPDANAPRPERQRRPSLEAFERLTDQILRG